MGLLQGKLPSLQAQQELSGKVLQEFCQRGTK